MVCFYRWRAIIVVASLAWLSQAVRKSGSGLLDTQDLRENGGGRGSFEEGLGKKKEGSANITSTDRCPTNHLARCIASNPNDTKAGPYPWVCTNGPQRWRKCPWPFSSEFAWASDGEFRVEDLVAVARGGHLKGIGDVPEAHRADLLKFGVQVMTDLDDTVECSGGAHFKGIDTSCEKTVKIGDHKIYQDVANFFYALSLGWRENVNWGVTAARRVVPFSARPREGKAFLAVKPCDQRDLAMRKGLCVNTRTNFSRDCGDKQACIDGECNCFGMNMEDAQYGRLRDGLDYMNLGYRKFKNWRLFRVKHNAQAQVPMVFVGDNGQGDLWAAQMMRVMSQQIDNGDGAVIAAFIHDVKQECTIPECKSAWAKHNIFHFSTYAEAIAKAQELRLFPSHPRP